MVITPQTIKHTHIMMDTQSASVVRKLIDFSKNRALLELNTLFSHEPNRNDWLFKSWGNFTFDFTKQLVSQEIFSALLSLAETSELKGKISALVKGESVNRSEQRPALHTALRMPKSESLTINQCNVVDGVHDSLMKMSSIVSKVHNGQWRGYSGKPVTDIVNIGVGGSDLGPFMVTNALKDFRADWKVHLDFHFVSSMDGTQIFKLLETLNPETCLFIISSKSFTTIDTFYNADTAMEWMLGACPDKSLVVKQHFIGVSASPDKMTAWGISPDNQLLFWDWVGGRFSLWSAIGLPIALSIGMKNFEGLLAGAHEMDKHFATAPYEHNIPVLLGLIGVWNATFLNINAHTVLPYDGRLQFLPNYLTQLEMESNGKAVTVDGAKVEYKTCPILWGDIGPNAQHAFYQLLHQGTQKVSCDFIAPIKRYHDTSNGAGTDEFLVKQHKLSLANCLAQSRVLAFGNKAVSAAENLPAHKFYNGNQPSTTILMDELNPHTLGSLIALYEHKVFVMASIWDINPFDQWGVELGKVIANELFEAIQQESEVTDLDISTKNLLEMIRNKA